MSCVSELKTNWVKTSARPTKDEQCDKDKFEGKTRLKLACIQVYWVCCRCVHQIV